MCQCLVVDRWWTSAPAAAGCSQWRDCPVVPPGCCNRRPTLPTRPPAPAHQAGLIPPAARGVEWKTVAVSRNRARLELPAPATTSSHGRLVGARAAVGRSPRPLIATGFRPRGLPAPPRGLSINDTTLGNWVKADRVEPGVPDQSGLAPLTAAERADLVLGVISLGLLRRELHRPPAPDTGTAPVPAPVPAPPADDETRRLGRLRWPLMCCVARCRTHGSASGSRARADAMVGAGGQRQAGVARSE